MMSKNVIISDLNTNVEDGYKCHNGLWIWYRLGLIVYPIWILMLMMGKNVIISDLDTNVKDGYECYEFDIGWVWLFIWSGSNVKDGYELRDK